MMSDLSIAERQRSIGMMVRDSAPNSVNNYFDSDSGFDDAVSEFDSFSDDMYEEERLIELHNQIMSINATAKNHAVKGRTVLNGSVNSVTIPDASKDKEKEKLELEKRQQQQKKRVITATKQREKEKGTVITARDIPLSLLNSAYELLEVKQGERMSQNKAISAILYAYRVRGLNYDDVDPSIVECASRIDVSSQQEKSISATERLTSVIRDLSRKVEMLIIVQLYSLFSRMTGKTLPKEGGLASLTYKIDGFDQVMKNLENARNRMFNNNGKPFT